MGKVSKQCKVDFKIQNFPTRQTYLQINKLGLYNMALNTGC